MTTRPSFDAPRHDGDGASVEIERKFHLDGVPADLEGSGSNTVIEQGYLAIHDDGTEVRIRSRGGRYLLTVKSAGGLTRVEEELEIDRDRFRSLWPLTAGRRIHKVRSTIGLDGGVTVELDVYEGTLSGLVTAEIEFTSEGESASFEPPLWLGREVTGNPKYRNQSLATNGLPR